MNEIDDNLRWQAFRYVANEMNESESESFESRLLTDQTAREAVAAVVGEAIQIRQSFTDSQATPASSQHLNWTRSSRRSAIVVAGSSLSLLLALLVVWTSYPIADSRIRLATEDDSTSLAHAWIEARGESLDIEHDAEAELTDSLDVAIGSLIAAEDDESLVAPTWMLAALAKLDAGADFNELMQE